MAAKLTNEEWNLQVLSLVGNSYIFLSPYKGAYVKLPYYHIDCGHISYMNPHNFKSGKRCPYCNRGHKFKPGERKGIHTGTPKKTNEQYLKQLNDVHHGSIVLLDTYVNSKTALHFRCTVCGNLLYNNPNDMLKHRCRFCVAREKVKTRKSNYRMPSPEWSNGEKLIATYLFINKITYKYAISFPELKDINLLTYDFLIPEMKLLIEYQGIQHYKPCTWNKRYTIKEAKRRLEVQKKHDDLKKIYAKEHGYVLLCISYKIKTLDNLSKILDRYCNK